MNPPINCKEISEVNICISSNSFFFFIIITFSDFISDYSVRTYQIMKNQLQSFTLGFKKYRLSILITWHIATLVYVYILTQGNLVFYLNLTSQHLLVSLDLNNLMV